MRDQSSERQSVILGKIRLVTPIVRASRPKQPRGFVAFEFGGKSVGLGYHFVRYRRARRFSWLRPITGLEIQVATDTSVMSLSAMTGKVFSQ